MQRSISVATTQLDIAPAPLAERLTRAEALVTRAAQAGAQLIALPELFNTGYCHRDENFALAETADGTTPQWMKQTAARLEIHLAGSLLLRDGQDIYNALLLYAPDGHVWRYDKNYPAGWERAYCRGHRAITIAETELGSIGMMLCWDMAHADLWEKYANKVDLILACSCPPNLSKPVYYFPNGAQVTGDQMGPVLANLRQAEHKIFVETTSQQCAWLGVPFIGSTACGIFDTSLPNPVGSFLGFLPAAPWLVRHLPHVRQMKVRAGVVEAARVFDAEGRQLAALCSGQGEAFVLAEVTIPAERPQPRGPQPKPLVSWLMYFIFDKFLTTVSLGTYARRPLHKG